MIIATRYKPNAVVTFSTETGDIVVRAKAEREGDSIDGSVISINTNNDISTDAGTFQIQLAANEKWDEILASNDLVWIKMDRNGKAESRPAQSTVFVGLIDDVRKNVTLQGDSAQRTMVVTGRSFAKALINFEVGTVAEVDMSLNNGWLMNRLAFAQQPAHAIVDGLLKELVYKYMNYTFNNGETFESLVQTDLTSRIGEQLYDQSSFLNYQGSVWSFIREVVNEPFNQVFFECYEKNSGKPTIVTRETPFNQNRWQELPLHTITDEEVVLDDIGRSDVETYTLFSVGMQSFFSSFDINKTVNQRPYWYEPYFKKFGLRRMNRFTNYVGYASGEDSDQAEKMKGYQRDLYNWNIMNPIFFNGHVTVMGDQRYKIGDRLLYKSVEGKRDLEFFIESVSHDFMNFGYWTTRLALTRGLPESGKNRFAEPWDTYTTYESSALGNSSIPEGYVDTTPTGTVVTPDLNFPNIPASGIASIVIDYAKGFIGKVTYRMGWGRSQSDINKNHFDCSSFVRHVFDRNGLTMGSLTSVTTDILAKQGKSVNLAAIKPGDLIFFNTYKYNGHVGIYIGDNKFIGAQSSGVNIQDVNYWIKKYGLGSIRSVI